MQRHLPIRATQTGLLGDAEVYRVLRPIELALPQAQKFLGGRELLPQVPALLDIGRQQAGVVEHVIEDFRRRQAPPHSIRFSRCLISRYRYLDIAKIFNIFNWLTILLRNFCQKYFGHPLTPPRLYPKSAPKLSALSSVEC